MTCRSEQTDVPRTFLSKDRNWALVSVAEELYTILRNVEAVLGPKHHISSDIANLIDIIERS